VLHSPCVRQHGHEQNLLHVVQEERQSFTEQYTDAGFRDAFREQHPGVVAYTYFSHRFGMRAKGKGWRLDYYLVRSTELNLTFTETCIIPLLVAQQAGAKVWTSWPLPLGMCWLHNFPWTLLKNGGFSSGSAGPDM
jgi:hypothetical protein